MHLHHAVGNAKGGLGGEELGGGCLTAEGLSLVGQPGGVVDQPAQALDLRRRIGDEVLDDLLEGNWPAKLNVLHRESYALVYGSLAGSQGDGAQAQTGHVQGPQSDLETLALLAQQIGRRYAAIGHV